MIDPTRILDPDAQMTDEMWAHLGEHMETWGYRNADGDIRQISRSTVMLASILWRATKRIERLLGKNEKAREHNILLRDEKDRLATECRQWRDKCQKGAHAVVEVADSAQQSLLRSIAIDLAGLVGRLLHEKGEAE